MTIKQHGTCRFPSVETTLYILGDILMCESTLMNQYLCTWLEVQSHGTVVIYFLRRKKEGIIIRFITWVKKVYGFLWFLFCYGA